MSKELPSWMRSSEARVLTSTDTRIMAMSKGLRMVPPMLRLHAMIEESEKTTNFWVSDGFQGSEPWVDGGRKMAMARVLDLCESRGVSSLEIHSPGSVKCYASSLDTRGRIVWVGSVRPKSEDPFLLC